MAGSLLITWQRWQSHHSIWHSWKPHAKSKLRGSIFYRIGVTAYQSFTLREKEFFTFSSPMTLTWARWPPYRNLNVFPGNIPDVKIWTSHIKAFKSYLTDRHTHTTEIIYHTAASRVVKMCLFTEMCFIYYVQCTQVQITHHSAQQPSICTCPMLQGCMYTERLFSELNSAVHNWNWLRLWTQQSCAITKIWNKNHKRHSTYLIIAAELLCNFKEAEQVDCTCHTISTLLWA